MAISTRLTQRFNIIHPVISAPMDVIAGGKLAAAVSGAGGLGMLGGGYSDDDGWFEREFDAAGNQAIGCGFITWALRQNPKILDAVIDRKPKAIFLSFDDPEPFASKAKAAGIAVICQLQTRADAERAIDCGVDVIVAQGTEGGGHGGARATLTLVPELADLIAKRAPQTLLCAAGGIVDGRGLAAALMLGADGVVVGTRFWASQEALVHPNLHRRRSPHRATTLYGRACSTSCASAPGRHATPAACSRTTSCANGWAVRASCGMPRPSRPRVIARRPRPAMRPLLPPSSARASA